MTAELPEVLPGVANALLILCDTHGGADLSVRIVEYTAMGRPMISIGSMSWDRDRVMQAATDGWIEIQKDERAGVVCRPTEAGYDWLGHYRARQLKKGRATL